MRKIVNVVTVVMCAASLCLTGCSARSSGPVMPGISHADQSPALNTSRQYSPQEAHAIAIGTPAPTVNPCSGTIITCHASQRTDIAPLGALTPVSQIPGLHPADLQSAYALPSGSSSGVGQTIAIVVPFSSSTAAADLAVYRAKFGLPACATSTGCLRFVAQNGSSHLPGSNPGWTAETAIDLDMASAVCPNCKLVVVEANDDSLSNMVLALLEAVAQKANVVSNSWSVAESYSGQAMPGVFSHPGVAVVAGSGDSGAGVSWPAAEPSIIAVGGTTLMRVTAQRGWYEAAWTHAGYGCSTAFAKPAWQTSTPCTTRAVADVSAVADPNTGVAIYDSAGQGKGPAALRGGWEVYGGTSVATPIVAGAIALAGNASQLSTAQYIYTHTSGLNSVVMGASALQTGLGSPNGTTAL